MDKLSTKYKPYAKGYEEEMCSLKGDDYRILSYLRLKAGGEGQITWYKKNTLSQKLNVEIRRLNAALDRLEELGAIIVFNVKDKKTKRNCSNIYFLSEYNQESDGYLSTHSIEDIKHIAYKIRRNKEITYAYENNSTPRDFELSLRLPKIERKLKWESLINKNPHYENGSVDPEYENGTVEPHYENGTIINNYNKLNNYNTLNNNNIYKEEKSKDVVVDENEIGLIREYFNSYLQKEVSFTDKDIVSIAKAYKKKHSVSIVDGQGFKKVCKLINDYKKPILNATGFILTSIERDYDTKDITPNENTIGFVKNCCEPREYDYNELERKLLGWTND